MKNIPIGTVGGVVKSQRGEVIAIMHQYAIVERGRSIHSSGQLEYYKNDVNDKSIEVEGGLQRIKTIDGHLHPIDIINGLPYSPIRPFADEEWKTLPHVVWTSNEDWDPSILDNVIGDDSKWHKNLFDDKGKYLDSPFNIYGDYVYGEPGWKDNGNYNAIEAMVYNTMDLNAQDQFAHKETILLKDLLLFNDDDDIDYEIIEYNDDYLVQFDDNRSLVIAKGERKLSDSKYVQLKPCFLFKPKEIIERTLEATTQFGRSILSGPIIRYKMRSPFPANNVMC